MNEQLPVKSDSLFFDVERFEFAQRVAKVFAASTMVPEHFKNNVGNCLIALNYAARIQADPFMTMQNMYVVHGKPGIEGKLVIGLVNQSGRFEPLEFNETPESCFAFAKEIRTGKILEGPKVTLDMVKAEGWYDKKGSKWKTMFQLVARYRSAAFFARTYCPEVLLGMQTKEEIIDLGPGTFNPTIEAEKEIPIYNPKADTDKSKKIEAKEFKPEPRVYSEQELKDMVAKQPDPEPETEPPTKEPTKPQKSIVVGQEKEQTEEERHSEPLEKFRKKWINLRKAGFADFVHKNHIQISALPEGQLEEMRNKWSPFYPDIDFPKCLKVAEPETTTDPPKPGSYEYVFAGKNLVDTQSYKDLMVTCQNVSQEIIIQVHEELNMMDPETPEDCEALSRRMIALHDQQINAESEVKF